MSDIWGLKLTTTLSSHLSFLQPHGHREYCPCVYLEDNQVIKQSMKSEGKPFLWEARALLLPDPGRIQLGRYGFRWLGWLLLAPLKIRRKDNKEDHSADKHVGC